MISPIPVEQRQSPGTIITALDSRWFVGAVSSMMIEVVTLIVCAACLIVAELYASAALAVVAAACNALSIALHLGGTVAHVHQEPLPVVPVARSPAAQTTSVAQIGERPRPAHDPASEKDDSLQPSASVATALPPAGMARNNSLMSASLTSISMSSMSRSPSSGKITVNTIDRDHRVVVATSAPGAAAAAARDLTPIEISPNLSRVSSVNEVRRINAAHSDGLASISGAREDDSAGTPALQGILPMMQSPKQRAPQRTLHEPTMVPEPSNRVVSGLCAVAYLAFAICAVIEVKNAAFAVAAIAGCAHLLMPWLYEPGAAVFRALLVIAASCVWLALVLINAFALNHAAYSDMRYYVDYGAIPVALFACVMSPIIRLLGAANISLVDTGAAMDADAIENGLWDVMCDGSDGAWLDNLHHDGLAVALQHFIEAYQSAQQFVPNDQVLRVSDTPHSSDRWNKTLHTSSKTNSISSRPSSAAFLQSTMSVLASDFPNTPTVTLNKGKVAIVCIQEQSTTAPLSRYSDVTALSAVYHVVEAAVRNVQAVTVLPGAGQCIQVAIRYLHQSDLAGRNALRVATLVAEGCQREGIPVSISVVTGVATVGVFGQAPKTVRVVGALSEAAVSLCNLASTLRCTVLCDEDIASEGALTHLMNPVELVQLLPWNFPRVVYRVVKPFDPLREEGVEWMYQIQRIAEQIPPPSWELRRAFMAFVRADVATALKTLDSLRNNEMLLESELEQEIDHLVARCQGLQTSVPMAQAPIPVLVSVALAVGVPPETVVVNPGSVLRPRKQW